MTSFDQMPFDASEFVDNPEPRCPCLLLLDTSSSMQGRRIEELNVGLSQFALQLIGDTLAAKRVEVSIMSFGPVHLETEFTTAEKFVAPKLNSGGATPMGEAINAGLDLIENRKRTYRDQGSHSETVSLLNLVNVSERSACSSASIWRPATAVRVRSNRVRSSR